MKIITIGGGGVLPCLNCGKMVKLDGEIHLCKANKRAWVKKQDKAIMQISNGDLWDIKNKKIIRKQDEPTRCN